MVESGEEKAVKIQINWRRSQIEKQHPHSFTEEI